MGKWRYEGIKRSSRVNSVLVSTLVCPVPDQCSLSCLLAKLLSNSFLGERFCCERAQGLRAATGLEDHAYMMQELEQVQL